MTQKEQELQLQLDELRRELKSVYNTVTQLQENLGVLGYTERGQTVEFLNHEKHNEWREKLAPCKDDRITNSSYRTEFDPDEPRKIVPLGEENKPSFS